MIWSPFGKVQVNLFVSQESFHCPLWYSLTGAPLCTAPGAFEVCISPSVPTDVVQGQRERRTSLDGRVVLAHPDLVLGAHAPHDSPSLANFPEQGVLFSGTGHNLAPTMRAVESSCLAPGWDKEDLSGLLPAMIDTITPVRASSTRWPML